MCKIGIVGLLVRRNVKWILAFAVVFVYASGVLANASGLSQLYSKEVTDEMLGFANNDFVVSQMEMPEMAEEVYGRLAALKDVRYVVSMVCLKMQLSVPEAWGNFGLSHKWNGDNNSFWRYILRELYRTRQTVDRNRA